MGNVHGVVGLRPCVSAEGARPGPRARCPSSVEIERQVPSVTLYDPNVFANRVPDRARAGTYLVVEGGGKWGYDEDLRAYVDAVLVP